MVTQDTRQPDWSTNIWFSYYMLQNSINVHVTLNNGSINKYFKTRGEYTVFFFMYFFLFWFFYFCCFFIYFGFFYFVFLSFVYFPFFSPYFFYPPLFLWVLHFFFLFFPKIVFFFFSNYDFFFNIKLVENLVMQFFSLKHYGLLQYFITWFFLWFFSFFFPKWSLSILFFYIELIENFAS